MVLVQLKRESEATGGWEACESDVGLSAFPMPLNKQLAALTSLGSNLPLALPLSRVSSILRSPHPLIWFLKRVLLFLCASKGTLASRSQGSHLPAPEYPRHLAISALRHPLPCGLYGDSL